MSKRNCCNCKINCCRVWGAHGVHATGDDIKKWIDNEASHILRYVPVVNGEYTFDLWVDSETGKREIVCPFLKDNKCSIYPEDGELDLRPTICGEYPGKKLCLQQTMTQRSISKTGSYHINIASFTKKRTIRDI